MEVLGPQAGFADNLPALAYERFDSVFDLPAIILELFDDAFEIVGMDGFQSFQGLEASLVEQQLDGVLDCFVEPEAFLFFIPFLKEPVEDFGLDFLAGAAAFVQEAVGDFLAQFLQFYVRGVVLGQAEFERERPDYVLDKAVDGFDGEVLVLVQDLAEFLPGAGLEVGMDPGGCFRAGFGLLPLSGAEQFFPIGIFAFGQLGKGFEYLALHVGRGGVGEGDGQDLECRAAGLEQVAHVFLGQGIGFSAPGGSFVNQQAAAVGCIEVCKVLHGGCFRVGKIGPDMAVSIGRGSAGIEGIRPATRLPSIRPLSGSGRTRCICNTRNCPDSRCSASPGRGRACSRLFLPGIAGYAP